MIIFHEPIAAYQDILESYAVRLRSTMKFITEGEHVHSSTDAYKEQFSELATRLGLNGEFEDFEQDVC